MSLRSPALQRPVRQYHDPPDECEWRGCTSPPLWEAKWRDPDETPPRDFAYFCASHKAEVGERTPPSFWRAL